MKKLRIGILSTAGIGKKNWRAIFNSGNSIVSAVASRDLVKSRAFIAECQREHKFENEPRAFGSYEELLTSSDVDAVYVPLPTGLRKEFIIRAAQNGKHVICEKPCATSTADLEEMLAACKKNSVQFMDGVMFMHSPRLQKIREALNDPESIGPIRRFSTAFSFYNSSEDFFRDNIRVNGALEPAGCLGDLGWYCLRMALWTLDWGLPASVNGKILSQSESRPSRPSSPTEFSGELFYDDGVSVGFYCSFLAGKQQWAAISGQKGCLHVPDFVHAFDSYEPSFKVNRTDVRVAAEDGVTCPPGVDPMRQGHPFCQDTRMFRNFANQIASGKLNDDWPMWVLQTQKVMDACLEAARSGVPVKMN